MSDIETLEDIKFIVDSFYAKAGKDELLAPIFESKLENGNWQPHLEKMYAFWQTVLFHEISYKGSPYMKHHPLPINPSHFERWLQLFNETIDQLFKGDRAEDAKKRVDSMAQLFMAKMEYYRKNPEKRPLV